VSTSQLVDHGWVEVWHVPGWRLSTLSSLTDSTGSRVNSMQISRFSLE
jgi:hypothetical protein